MKDGMLYYREAVDRDMFQDFEDQGQKLVQIFESVDRQEKKALEDVWKQIELAHADKARDLIKSDFLSLNPLPHDLYKIAP